MSETLTILPQLADFPNSTDGFSPYRGGFVSLPKSSPSLATNSI
jgi:hypothetical protein